MFNNHAGDLWEQEIRPDYTAPCSKPFNIPPDSILKDNTIPENQTKGMPAYLPPILSVWVIKTFAAARIIDLSESDPAIPIRKSKKGMYRI
jgi:hypothetical protein